MTHETMNYWILGTSVALGIALVLFAPKRRKGVIWNLLSISLVLGGFILVEHRNDDHLMNEQIDTIHQELNSRFYLSGVHVTRTEKQTRSSGNQYVIDGENGQYTAQFNPDQSSGFELNEKHGESLRSRRNAYEAIMSIPDSIGIPEAYLEYQSDDLYTLEGELGNWEIHMDDQVVVRVLDDEGIVRYTQQERPNTYEGEIKDESHN